MMRYYTYLNIKYGYVNNHGAIMNGFDHIKIPSNAPLLRTRYLLANVLPECCPFCAAIWSINIHEIPTLPLDGQRAKMCPSR